MKITDLYVREDAVSVEDGDVFEMANLPEAKTGIKGVIYISTQQGQHGPRVKYYLKPGRRNPFFAVSISPDPEVLEATLPPHVVSGAAPQVIEWVRLNHEKLREFWDHGDEWMDDAVDAFKAGLVKLPRNRTARNASPETRNP